jgi:hypothetical protein
MVHVLPQERPVADAGMRPAWRDGRSCCLPFTYGGLGEASRAAPLAISASISASL